MEPTYAGRIENGVVVDAIVGTAEWAIANIGGEWHDSTERIYLPGIWDEEHGFRPPQPFPDCEWIDGEWVCPEVIEE